VSRTAEIRPSFCRICAAACGLLVEVDRDTVIGVRGNRAHPLSGGYTCPKGRALPELHHGPERLDAPLLRTGERLVATSWEACLLDLGVRLRAIALRHGPAAIGFFLGSGGYFDSAGLFMAMRLREALATPSFYSDTSIDVISTMVVSELVTGRPGLLGKPDLERAPLLIVVGSNPVVSHGQTLIFANPVTQLRALRARGALWVIDPRRTKTAELANGHLAARPGGDHAIFAFLVRELLREGADRDYLARHAAGVETLAREVEPFGAKRAAEVAGVPPEQLAQLLAAIRKAGRVSVLTGTGLSMAPDANLANWFIRALQVITRSADFPGGVSFNPGFFGAPEPQSPAAATTGTRAPGPPSRPELPSWLGEYPCAAFADEVEAGHLRALIVLGANPALQMPDTRRTRAALRRLEVLAVADVVPNETSALASHVLACAGQLERPDLTLIHDSLLPHVMAQYTPAVVPRHARRRPLWSATDGTPFASIRKSM
jgi:anaerobic selenocysteine-containing dehydrogenase